MGGGEGESGKRLIDREDHIIISWSHGMGGSRGNGVISCLVVYICVADFALRWGGGGLLCVRVVGVGGG